jgi:toxin YoeB
MHVYWSDEAWDDYLFWYNHDKKIHSRINSLIESIHKTPYSGIGKPEKLKYKHGKEWSRRINREHRLVYIVENSKITILQCRYHY